jgi:hypothetical protein
MTSPSNLDVVLMWTQKWKCLMSAFVANTHILSEAMHRQTKKGSLQWKERLPITECGFGQILQKTRWKWKVQTLGKYQNMPYWRLILVTYAAGHHWAHYSLYQNWIHKFFHFQNFLNHTLKYWQFFQNLKSISKIWS